MQGWTSATECSVTHWRQSDSRKTQPAATAVAAGCAACLGLANKTNSNKMFSSFSLFLIGVQTFFFRLFCAKQKTKRTFLRLGVPSRKPKELFPGLLWQAQNQKNFAQAFSRKPKEKTKQRRTRLPAERAHSRTSIETKKRRGKHFDARLDVCH